jgi:hypothetical protein
MDIDAITVGEGFESHEMAGTRQDERCRTMGALAGRVVLLVQITGAHAEDVPKMRRKRSKWEKATAGESELEWTQLKGKSAGRTEAGGQLRTDTPSGI